MLTSLICFKESFHPLLFLIFPVQNQPISIHIQSALRRAAIGLTPKKPTKQSHQSVKSKTESNRTGAREKARASHRASSKNRRLKVTDSSRGLKLHELDKDSKTYQPTARKPAVSNGSGVGVRRPGSAEKEAERIFALLDIVQDEAENKSKITTKSKVHLWFTRRRLLFLRKVINSYQEWFSFVSLGLVHLHKYFTFACCKKENTTFWKVRHRFFPWDSNMLATLWEIDCGV